MSIPVAANLPKILKFVALKGEKRK